MHAHTHTYIHIHAHTYTRKHTHSTQVRTCTNAQTHPYKAYENYTHTHTHTHTNTQTHTHIHTNTHVHTYTHKHTRTHTHTYTHTRTHTHTSTHTHTHVRISTLQTAASNGAKLVVLPEMFNCPYANESFPVYAEDIDGGNRPSVDALSQVCVCVWCQIQTFTYGVLWRHTRPLLFRDLSCFLISTCHSLRCKAYIRVQARVCVFRIHI